MADDTPNDPKAAAEAGRKARREAPTIEGAANRPGPPPAPGGAKLVPALIGGVAGAALATLITVLLPAGAPAGLTTRLDEIDARAKASAESLLQLDKRLAAAEAAIRVAEAAAKSATAGLAGATQAAKTAEGVARGAEGLAMAAAGAAEAGRVEAARLSLRLDEAPALPAAKVDLGPLEARLARAEQSAAEAGKAAAAGVPVPNLKPIEDRIAALEGRPAPTLKPVEDRLATLESRQPGALKPIEERLAALEGRVSAPVDLGPLAARLEALEKRLAPVESSLSDTKSTARVTAEREAGLGASSRAAALAVTAQAVAQALDRGRPYAAEAMTLETLGVAAERLAPLKRLAADGAPTAAALAEAFAPLAAQVAANAGPQDKAGLGDRLAAVAGRLVQVRRLGEGGDDAAGLATRIETALTRGAVGEAFAAWAKLPGPAKAGSKNFGDTLSARAEADAAALAILAEAIAALGRKS